MEVMRSLISAAKFLPCALLVVVSAALIFSTFGSCSIQTHYNEGWGYDFELYDGCAVISIPKYVEPIQIPPYFFLGLERCSLVELLGKFEVQTSNSAGWVGLQCAIPLLAIMTILLPPAIGPFLKYRFPLWSWFAYLAVLAGEMAIYLR
jgi:hypothetical protein